MKGQLQLLTHIDFRKNDCGIRGIHATLEGAVPVNFSNWRSNSTGFPCLTSSIAFVSSESNSFTLSILFENTPNPFAMEQKSIFGFSKSRNSKSPASLAQCCEDVSMGRHSAAQQALFKIT